jgi:hypothetical protein
MKGTTSKILPLIFILLSSFCSPVEDKFLQETLLDFEKIGFLHPHLFQMRCKGEIQTIGLTYSEIRKQSLEKAVEICREKIAYAWAIFYFENEKKLEQRLPLESTMLNEKTIPVYDIPLTKRQLQSLITDFEDLLDNSYIARENYDRAGFASVVFRVYASGLAVKILKKELKITFKKKN